MSSVNGEQNGAAARETRGNCTPPSSPVRTSDNGDNAPSSEPRVSKSPEPTVTSHGHQTTNANGESRPFPEVTGESGAATDNNPQTHEWTGNDNAMSGINLDTLDYVEVQVQSSEP